MGDTQAKSEAQEPLGRVQQAIPVLLRLAGLVGFVVAQVLWLALDRPEPEFMAICLTVASGGYIVEGLFGLRARPAPPSLPEQNGAAPATEERGA